MKKEEFEKYINKIVDERVNKILKSEQFQTLLESRLFRMQNSAPRLTEVRTPTLPKKPVTNKNILAEMMGLGQVEKSSVQTPNFAIPQGTPAPVAGVLNILHNKFNLPVDEFSSVEPDLELSEAQLMSGNY